MRKLTVIALSVLVLSTAFAGVALAQTPATTPAPATTTQGQYPDVHSLKPFSAEANYMSLAGYLRYLVFQQTGQWLTRAEAVRIVAQQSGM
jgi:uncharacterized protein YdeI (BOF family)